jgi:nucleotide-binding universal stress UspA family protein
MFKNVLVTLDGSPRSERSLDWVKLVARDAHIHLLRTVVPNYAVDIYAGPLVTDLQAEAERYLQKIARDFVPQARIQVRFGPAAGSILDVAEEVKADLIALTTHGGSPVTRRVFGGTAEQLIHGSPIPLLIVPSWTETAPEPKIRKIVVPLDGSKVSESILPMAGRLGQENDATLVLAHALTEGEEARRRYAELEGHFRGLTVQLDRDWISTRYRIEEGPPAETLARIVESEKADLIVMSAHGHGALKRMLFGSVASRVLREAHVPALVARFEALERLRPRAEKKTSAA